MRPYQVFLGVTSILGILLVLNRAWFAYRRPLLRRQRQRLARIRAMTEKLSLRLDVTCSLTLPFIDGEIPSKLRELRWIALDRLRRAEGSMADPEELARRNEDTRAVMRRADDAVQLADVVRLAFEMARDHELEQRDFLEEERRRVEMLRIRLLDRIERSGNGHRLRQTVLDATKLKNALEASRVPGSTALIRGLVAKALDRMLALTDEAAGVLGLREYVEARDEELSWRVARAKCRLAAIESVDDHADGFRPLPALIESVDNRRRAARSPT
ncbi:MAG: hypothetical protein AAB692_01465 [Patescibacteria group bacterium]